MQPAHTAFRLARRAAERALALDDSLSEAHCSLAEVLKNYDWDWTAAEHEFRRAIELNANHSTAHHFYAQLLLTLKRFDEAISQMELARSTDPLSPAINAYLPYVYLAARDYGRALTEGRRAVHLEPYSPLARWALGRALLFADSPAEAVSELETAVKFGGAMSMWQASLCYARARAGDRDGAQALLDDLLQRAKTAYISPFDIAFCFLGLGDQDAALDFLECSYRERIMRIICIGDPEWDCLHKERRFISLAEQLRIPLHQLPIRAKPTVQR